MVVHGRCANEIWRPPCITCEKTRGRDHQTTVSHKIHGKCTMICYQIIRFVIFFMDVDGFSVSRPCAQFFNEPHEWNNTNFNGFVRELCRKWVCYNMAWNRSHAIHGFCAYRFIQNFYLFETAKRAKTWRFRGINHAKKDFLVRFGFCSETISVSRQTPTCLLSSLPEIRDLLDDTKKRQHIDSLDLIWRCCTSGSGLENSCPVERIICRTTIISPFVCFWQYADLK